MVGILLTKNGFGSKVMTNDGSEIQGISRIQITAEVNEPTRADIELVLVDVTRAEDVQARFIVGGYQDVTALILANGSRVELDSTRKFIK